MKGKRSRPTRPRSSASGEVRGKPRDGGRNAPVALVTGSAKRLGREIAVRLGALGYFVWVHYLGSKGAAEDTLAVIRGEGGEGSLLRGDMGRKRDVEAMARRIGEASGRLDALVNNVGIYRTGDLLAYPVEDFEATLRANLTGPFHLIQQLLPLFPSEGGAARPGGTARPGGAIVNIGYAGIENLTAATHNTAYLISKSGLYVLTKSLAQALGPRGIRVNMVSPGILDNSVELPRRPGDQVPLGRLGTVAEVCDAVEFLLGKRAGYITGVNLDVAGGYLLRLRGLEPGPDR